MEPNLIFKELTRAEIFIGKKNEIKIKYNSNSKRTNKIKINI